MCGIYGSFKGNKFTALGELNRSRGVKQSSVEMFNIGTSLYTIGHVQTPTSNSARKHPAVHENGARLWHNGIIKDTCLNEYEYIDYDGWDTMFILKLLEESGAGALSNIDGSFACVYQKASGNVFVFRNEIAPLYIDNDLNLSSIKHEDMTLLPPNKVFAITSEKKLVVAAEFTTKNNPYNL